MLPRHPQRQAVTDFRQDVLSQHSPPRANSPGKPDSIIALTRTDISDGHTRSDPCAIHDVVGFVQPVAAFLVRPARGLIWATGRSARGKSRALSGRSLSDFETS